MVASSSSGSRDGATSGRSRGGGGGGGGSQQAVKKGPWTTAEDAILMEYVRKHGEGNWNAVQRNSGLLRCGKSCRLRWANHLRPNLKKGAFSPEEERLIIELHAKLGNKWARMASQLPGRTDNEIKNYWNTRVKRLQRAGLPIYPDDIPQPYDQPQQLQHQQRLPNPNSSSPSFSSLFSSPSPSSSQYSTSKFNPPLSLFHPYSFPTMANPLQTTITSSFLSNSNSISNPQINLFRDNNRSSGGFVLPFSPSPSTSSLFNQSYQNELLPTYPQPLQFNSGGFDISPPPPPPSTMGASFNPLGLVPGTVTELSSIQSPVPGSTTPASSGSTGGGDCMIGGTPSADADEYSINIAPEVGNSGLLDALLEESKALSHADKLKKQISSAAVGKGKGIWVSGSGLSDDAARGVYDSSSAHSSIGMKENDPLEEMNPMDDDLSSLLNNFPLTVPVPDWYDASATSSNGQSSSNMKDGYSGLNNLPQASPSPVATTLATTNPRRTLGSCCWNNMPDIC